MKPYDYFSSLDIHPFLIGITLLEIGKQILLETLREMHLHVAHRYLDTSSILYLDVLDVLR